MAVNDLLPELTVPDRSAIRAAWLRDYKFAVPDADVGPKTQPDADASTFADNALPIYSNAQKIAEGTTLRTSRTVWLDRHAESRGLTRLDAIGASGSVTITASVGGTNILLGDEIKEPQSGLRFACAQAGIYFDGEEVPTIGVDVGPETNLAAGTVMQWTSPRPGCGPTAIIYEQSDGEGFSGGRDAESDDELVDRIIDVQQNPPASGNDAQIIAVVEATPNVSIQKCFTIPAISGPGTTAVMFTMRPSTLGASRIPSATVRALVDANLRVIFPPDWGLFVCALIAVPSSAILKVKWTATTPGWADIAPWPAIATPAVSVTSALPGALAFRAGTTVDTTTPQVGQTIGLYNGTLGTFSRKRIKTVAVVIANRSWDLTFESANNASDTTFVPEQDALISPWSDSLDLLVPPLLTEFETLGPGEQIALPVGYDPGRRGVRQPESPAEWPHEITGKFLTPILELPGVHNMLSVSMPTTTAVGTPTVSSNLLELGDFAVMALA